MKTTKTLFTIFILLQCITAFSQVGNAKRAWHWYFGWNAGLDFSSGTMQDDPNGQVYIAEGACSISDTAGNLLFYAGPNLFSEPGENNMTIYNANHEIMQNGTDIDCGWSGRQNSIIVPLPENDNIYYLFTIGHYTEPYYTQLGFKYSIVDMSLNGGIGAVIEKNIEIFTSSQNDTLSEILTAVHHANCKDIWILIHRNNTCRYNVYKLTENGLETEPVITNIGYHDTGNYSIGFGAKFSSNGKYLAVNKSYNWISDSEYLKSDSLELYKFNNSTGILSDRITLPMDSALSGKEFSPNCNYLYTFEIRNYELPRLFQYDISKWQESYISNSKTLIGSYLILYSDLQLTPFNEIIISGECDTVSVIEQPNNQGTSCSVNTNVLTLSNTCGCNLPNFIRSYFNADTSSYNCDTATYIKKYSDKNVSVYPNPLNSNAIVNTNGKIIKRFALFDLTGKIIDFNQYQFEIVSNHKYMFNNFNLKGGIYFLNVQFENGELFKVKLIIN
ncbi:MAG: T9SS type A sorting domain-containing protein [Bacteroidales bacterium]|nr:T9SS type A sorting domain-containing protein [Bacteroidales bacterium]